MSTIDVVWDMETHDPDDFITLLLLLGHPAVRLRAVTITPGSADQVGLVRRALSWFDAEIPVGANNIDHPKSCVSSWHRHAFGPVPPSRAAEPAGALLRRVCDEHTTLIMGGPLKNLGAAMDVPGFHVGRLVAQGGFAGEGVVPREKQLEKFRGRTTCPTFNFNGDPRSARRALTYPGIGTRRFVSKNVCHGVVYDDAMHTRLAAVKAGALSLERIWQGMDVYLARSRARAGDNGPRIDDEITAEQVALIGRDGARLGVVSLAQAQAAARDAGISLVEVSRDRSPPVCRLMPPPTRTTSESAPGKKLHDPLAACCAIDESIATWAEVELYSERGEWGARLRPGSGTWIITDYDHARFLDVMLRRN